MHEDLRLSIKQVIQTCRNQNRIKTKPQTSTQDNVLRMDVKNIQQQKPRNALLKL
jgi:hypothetical protein